MKYVLAIFAIFALGSLLETASASLQSPITKYTCIELRSGAPAIDVTHITGHYPSFITGEFTMLKTLEFEGGYLPVGLTFSGGKPPESVDTNSCNEGGSISVLNIDNPTAQLVFNCRIDSTPGYTELIAELFCQPSLNYSH